MCNLFVINILQILNHFLDELGMNNFHSNMDSK